MTVRFIERLFSFLKRRKVLEVRTGLCSCYEERDFFSQYFVLESCQGYFCPKEKRIYLLKNSKEEYVDVIVNHESLHWVLNKFISSLISRKFDNLAPYYYVDVTKTTRKFVTKILGEDGVPTDYAIRKAKSLYRRKSNKVSSD